MADRGSWRTLMEGGVKWDAKGPYYPTSDGRKAYIPPIAAAQYDDDPRMLQWAQAQGATLRDSPQGITAGTSVPGGSLLKNRGTWNSQEGGYDQGINWGNVAALGVGGLIAAPAIAGLAAGAGGGAAAGGGATAASGGGTLASSAVPGFTGTFAAAPSLTAATSTGALAGGAGASGMGWGNLIGKGLDYYNQASDVLDTVGRVSDRIGGAASGAAQQRLSEAEQAMLLARIAQQGARDQFSSGLESAQFAREGQDRSRKSAMLMAALNGLQDAQITPANPRIAERMPQISGGLRPSAITGNKDALLALLAQPDVAAPSPYQPVQLPGVSKPGTGEQILGGIGTIGGILGAFSKPKWVEDDERRQA